MIRLYNQNIWGNMRSTERVANRSRLIRDLVYEYLPDVCTFQECNPNTIRQGDDAVHKLISDAYAEAFSSAADRNFTPVFYRKDTYREIDSGFWAYSGKNDIESKSVTWAVLERMEDGKRFGVASTHFWFKHLSEEDNLQRLQNVEELEKLCNYMEEMYQVPVLVAGDFNNGKQSPLGDEAYQVMVQKGFSDVRYHAAESTDCHTVHHPPTRNESGEYAYSDMPGSTIDYIFMYGAQKLTTQKFQVDTCEKALCSSDHCPMIAEFSWGE